MVLVHAPNRIDHLLAQGRVGIAKHHAVDVDGQGLAGHVLAQRIVLHAVEPRGGLVR